MCEHWYCKPDWLEAIGTIFGAISGPIIALFFGLKINEWIFRPKFSISFSLEDPYFVKHKDSLGIIGYYLRVGATNHGKTNLEGAIATIVELFEIQKGKKIRQKGFIPSNLEVSGSESPPQALGQASSKNFMLPPMAPKLPFYFDLGCFHRHAPGITEFEFSIAFKSISEYHILKPGKYIINIFFSANNCKQLSKACELEFADEWHDDEEVMKSYISIKEITNLPS